MPAALIMSAMATKTQLVAFAANLILFEYIVILPLQTFKMISNKQKYCEAGCEVLVKEQCIDLLFFVNFLRTSPAMECGKTIAQCSFSWAYSFL
jgi:hypothetical protein